MPVYYDKTRQRWFYDFSRVIDGRRQRTTKLLPAPWSAKEAEAYGQEQDARLYALATGALVEQPLISKAVRLYLEEVGPTLKNSAKLERDLGLCQAYYKGRRMNELADVVHKYAKDHKHLAPATVRNRMAYLRAACRWAWKSRHKLGDHDPAERVQMPTVSNERHVYLSRAEVLRLCRAMPDLWARACVLAAFYSGMRISEVLRAQVTDRGWLLTDSKNGERRLIPVHPKVAYLARQWPPPWSVRTIQKRVSEGLKAAGFEGVHFHDLRHSAASAMINAEVNLYTVGAVLGHKSAQSTQRYAHLASNTLEAAVAKIGGRR